MRILYVADGRSPIALNWIRYFVENGHEVHLASTYPCHPGLALASLTVVDVAMSRLAGEASATRGRDARRNALRRLIPVGLRTWARRWSGSLTVPSAARKLGKLADELQPELVHAMRIPFEGILAGSAVGSYGRSPLLVSVWGNDFTLHATSNPLVAQATRRALVAADGLHADCRRDMRLAQDWGYDAGKPGVVLPGAGGIQPEIFYPPADEGEREPVVINPRGIRNYVRSDTFFRSIPYILAEHPSARFVCPAMAGESQAAGWVRALGIEGAVHLLPVQSRPQMANLFRQARVAVSPSVHDGTPNTLLEAMACGCYPVAGDIESLREWIQPGKNGALFDPDDPQALADAVIEGLRNESLRRRARELNTALIAERATYRRVMASAENFYRRLREVAQAGTAS